MAIIEGGKKQKQMPHPACKLAGKQCLAAALQNILITLLWQRTPVYHRWR